MYDKFMPIERPSSVFVLWLIGQRDRESISGSAMAQKLGISRGAWSSLVDGINQEEPGPHSEVGLKVLAAVANTYGWTSAPAIMAFLMGNARLAKLRNKGKNSSKIAA